MKHFLASILLLCCVATINAQIFYKITGNGIEKASYILGSHHTAPTSLLDSLNGFYDALDSVDAVYGEMDMTTPPSMTTAFALAARMKAPQDSTLRKLFTPAQCDSISAVLKKYIDDKNNTPTEVLFSFIPVVISLELQTEMSFDNKDNDNGIDLYIQQQAKSRGKEVGGFETMEYQLNLLYGEPISAQAKDLITMIRNIDLVESSIKKLDQYYLDGNLEGLAEIMNDPILGDDFSSQERYITDRNNNWTKQISALLPNKSIMIVVGAGHLPGEQGLLNKLRQLGYTVTAM